jgi:3-isopropylmalate/(R)-2-methylmalate dehydratase small subunit
MKDTIQGKAYVVSDSVDTDQIIPAQHLVYSLTAPEERRLYGRFAMSGIPVDQQGLPDGHQPFVAAGAYTSEYTVIIAASNFGCGSSREHAPFALMEAGCEAVVAESFARIFYRNAVDGGFLAPFESDEPLSVQVSTGDEVKIDVAAGTLENLTTGKIFTLKPLGDVAEILKAGNVFEYARAAGLMAS